MVEELKDLGQLTSSVVREEGGSGVSWGFV
jgi:hypothetical protein